MSIEDVEKTVNRSEYGFHIKKGIEWHLPLKLTDKMGYVLRWMHEEEVAEHDGGEGRSFWINIGLDVFDITSMYRFLDGLS